MTKDKSTLDKATAAALALATATAETAKELAKAKVASDVTAAVLAADIGYIKLDVAEIKKVVKSLSERDSQYLTKEDFSKHTKDNEENMVTQDQFVIVKAIVYGMVSIILTGFIGGLMYLLINK